MKSETPGAGTLEAEVTHISKQGLWLLIGDKESFLPFERFPWRNRVSDPECEVA